jgi:hypothetical protein
MVIPVPAVNVILPAVGDIAPPDVLPVRVDTKKVPGVIDPVRVDPEPEKANGPAPITLILPPVGETAPPVLPVRVARAPLPPPNTVQVAFPPDNETNPYIVPVELSTARVPRSKLVSFVLGAPDVGMTVAGFTDCFPP